MENKVIEMGKEAVQKHYDDIFEMIDNYVIDTDTGNSPQHVIMVSILCLADFLTAQWIYGKSEEDAILETYNLGIALLGSIENSFNIDDSERARDYISSWFFMNKEIHFKYDKTNRNEPWGWIHGVEKEICILPTIFNSILKEGGFDPTRTLKDWNAKGWLKPKKGRNTNRRRHPIIGDEVTVVVIKDHILMSETN